MASVSTLLFHKLRLYAESRLFSVKFHFGHKISYLKSRLFVKSIFVKSRLYCKGICQNMGDLAGPLGGTQ